MTDLNKTVPQPRNAKLTFWAFEKERLQCIWNFISHKKVSDITTDIGAFALAWKICKKMPRNIFKLFITVNIYGIMYGITMGLKPYVDSLLYGSLPAVVTGAKTAIMLFFGFAMLLITQTIVSSIFFKLQENMAFKFRAIYFNQISLDRYKEILAKPRTFFVTNMPEIVSDLADKVTKNEAMLLKNAESFLSEIVRFVISAGSLFIISPLAMVAISFLAIVRMEYDFYWSTYFRNKDIKNRLFSAKVGMINRDVLRNSPLVQDGLKIQRECHFMANRLSKVTNNEIKVMFAEVKNSMASSYVSQFLVTVLAVLIAIDDILKTGDIGRFALINGAMYFMLTSCNIMRYFYVECMVKERNTIVDTLKQLETPKALERKCGKAVLTNQDSKISLKDVEFSYPKVKDVTKIEQGGDKVERGEVVISGVTTEIVKGGITVIAGTSGQGKSTVMSLIRHDYDVTGGEVLLGKENVQNLSDDVINKQIAFIDQNVHFFDNTLLYNLKYFKPNATDKEIKNALDSAGLSEDVSRFKDGVFHKIGQDGRALSGGQRQRLALARIFLTDRPIVIMDEPTTGLDQVLSFKVMKALRKLAKTKTVILVTHNPTEIALADRVLVIQSGKIVADGTPLNLIEKSDFLSSAMTKQDILSKQQLFAHC